MTNPKAAKLIQAELKKRAAPPINVLAECFPQQLEFIKDPSKRKKLCLTRRSGKSTTVGLYLINDALLNPRSNYVYAALTKDSAKKTMWSDIFETIILKYKVPAKLVGYQIKFENGSIIYLTGTDATYKEKHKLRGQKNRIAVVDECQSFTQDLKEIVESVIMPTLSDFDGTLCMIGTPGNEMGLHYWWQINDPKNKTGVWKDFHWTWKENPHVRDNIQKYLDELTAKDPLIINTSSFRQEWLGEWVIEDTAKVYKVSPDLNYIEQIPFGFLNANTVYLLSIDLGYIDATAFVVSAYNRAFDDRMYVLESKKHSKLYISAVAEKIREYQQRYKFQTMVVDAANRQAVEEMRVIHRLPLWAAEKQGKEAHIALMNSDLQIGRIKILKQTNLELIQELETLIWNQRALLQGKHQEDARKDNHLCFIAGTKVETIQGPKNIEDIKVGDLILTRKGYLPAIWSGQTGTEEIYHLQTKQGRELFATKTHPIFVEDKLIPLKDLRCGNILISILNKNIVADYVSTVKTTNQKLPVFNITVQDQHEYFANGILVSNTDALLYGHHNSRHYWYEAKKQINPNNEDVIHEALIKQHIQALGQQINTNFEVNYDE